MSKKKGNMWEHKSMPPYNMPPKIKKILQIYHGTTKEVQRDITFQLYQDILVYGVVAWQKFNVGGVDPTRTPMFVLELSKGFREAYAPLDRNKKRE